MSATFCPETASKWYRPDARKSARRPSDRPSSSPSTIPAITARRSPCRPGAIPAERCARSRSAKPARPPRRPTIRHRSARTTTCTPWRRSHVRSSKPFFGPRGSLISAIRSRIAPCGGERPGGRRSSTGSRISSRPEAPHLPRHAHVELRTPCRARHGDECSLRRPDAGQESAPVERVEPRASPPPAGQRECDSERGHPPRRRNGGRHRNHAERRQDDGERRSTRKIRSRQTETKARDQ